MLPVGSETAAMAHRLVNQGPAETSFSDGERATITTLFDCGSLENRELARDVRMGSMGSMKINMRAYIYAYSFQHTRLGRKLISEIVCVCICIVGEAERQILTCHIVVCYAEEGEICI